MPNLSLNITEKIVGNGYCIGCGVCVGVCPKNLITIKLQKSGIYAPQFTSDCQLESCNLCITSCPFWNQDENEDTLGKEQYFSNEDITHSNEMGYFLGAFVGYSKIGNHRLQGSSGGLATWLLEYLLKNGIVDHVICVSPNETSGMLFDYKVIDNQEEIQSASKSCYYPVNLSESIKYIVHHNGIYAITGLPCYIKAIRLAAKRNPKIRSRVKFLLGLTCGQMQTRYFVDYLCSMRGGDPKELKKVTFRIKDPNKPASDYGFFFECSGKKNISDTVYWSEGMGDAWLAGYFRPDACDYCDDIFAETADVTFMDAWLPEYSYDPKGTSIVIFRNPILQSIIEEGVVNQELDLKAIDPKQVLASQIGVIDKKRAQLAHRLYKVKKRAYIPNKRVIPAPCKDKYQEIFEALREIVRKKGRSAIFLEGGNLYEKIEKQTKIPKYVLTYYQKLLKLRKKVIVKLSNLKG